MLEHNLSRDFVVKQLPSKAGNSGGCESRPEGFGPVGSATVGEEREGLGKGQVSISRARPNNLILDRIGGKMNGGNDG